MVVWAVYVTVVGVVLTLAGELAERGLRHLGRPGRHLWAVVLASTALAGLLGSWRWVAAARVATVAELWLLAGWLAGSLVLLTSLRLSAWTLRRNERGWRARDVDGHRVLVTSGIGPGVMGGLRPRIVIPEWVATAAPGLRRLILRHEEEHVRAGDARLFHGLLALAALVPWCLPVWWQLNRAREAIETDCDARVLASATRREYAEALVAVAGGRVSRLAPALALAPGARELERRIRQVTAAPGARSRRSGWRYLGAAVALALGLAAIPIPPIEPADSQPRPAPTVADDREATIIFSAPPGLR